MTHSRSATQYPVEFFADCLPLPVQRLVVGSCTFGPAVWLVCICSLGEFLAIFCQQTLAILECMGNLTQVRKACSPALPVLTAAQLLS